MTDEALMERYQLGHPEAFEALYGRYATKLMGYLKKKGLSDYEAEEVFQKIFIQFHQTRQRYSSKYPVVSWIFTLARHALVDFLRSNKRWKESSPFEDSMEESFFASETIFESETSLLEKLECDERELVQKRFFDESTYEDIAKQMGISQDLARQKVSRAIKKLRHILKRPL